MTNEIQELETRAMDIKASTKERRAALKNLLQLVGIDPEAVHTVSDEDITAATIALRKGVSPVLLDLEDVDNPIGGSNGA